VTQKMRPADERQAVDADTIAHEPIRVQSAPRPYWSAPRWAFHPGLFDDPACLCVYLFLDSVGDAILTQRQIAESCHVSVRSVHTHLQHLESLGLIEIHARWDGNGRAENLYKLVSVETWGDWSWWPTKDQNPPAKSAGGPATVAGGPAKFAGGGLQNLPGPLDLSSPVDLSEKEKDLFANARDELIALGVWPAIAARYARYPQRVAAWIAWYTAEKRRRPELGPGYLVHCLSSERLPEDGPPQEPAAKSGKAWRYVRCPSCDSEWAAVGDGPWECPTCGAECHAGLEAVSGRG